VRRPIEKTVISLSPSLLTLEHLELSVQVLVKGKHSRDITTSIAVVGSRPDRDERALGEMVFEACEGGREGGRGGRSDAGITGVTIVFTLQRVNQKK